ncbi:hypothetical protein Aph02nite_68760 [Actinoplanes philippinensis]|uniref:Flavin reductase n=1 Tax=Actinoplanes philippinensis TaxID=35752 RepID=A0A1I2KLW1_9ACTN|nr:hypothetical protein [Actinoplanes philippinensis]GIE80926.1 hypothetical protein Aph02nite_68760 [Actinoplanes philippinensis]SFF67955.1 hypothetical protein SAMN05421541_117158 [Actinoplanes philippinensis]
MTDPLAAGAAHQPDPATYACLACTLPWPCTPARDYLVASTPDRVQLAMRMWDELEKVAGLDGQHPADLFDRFLRWMR